MPGKAAFETNCAADFLFAAGESCKSVLSRSGPAGQEERSETVYRPVGTVVAISSWISPLFHPMKKIAYALAAGNTVVLNPSRETPVIGLKIAHLFEAAGLPVGVLNVIPWSDNIIKDKLAQDERVSLISFTGQRAVARRVAQKAAAKLKQYSLELQGKDSLIILADADLDYAVDAAAFDTCLYQGSGSVVFERVILETPVADEFSQRLAAKARETTDSPLIGEVVMAAHVNT